MKNPRRLVSSALCFLFAVFCSVAVVRGIEVPAGGWHAVTNVTIVDVVSGRLRPGQTVVWDRSRIAAVGPGGTVTVPAEARVIDGAGKFLIPGLWDMHVHIRPEFDGATYALPMFIAHGVTSVRELGENPTGDEPFRANFARKETLNQEALAGLRVGPRFVGVGSLHVDGPSILRGRMPAFFGAATPDEARRLVRFIKDETGADFIKVYSRIPRDSFFAMMDEANRLGIDVAGHKPLAVSFVEAANAGMRSMEHARETILDSFPGAAALQANPSERNLPPSRLRSILEQQDPAMLQQIFAAMTRNHTYYTPTHTTRKFDASITDEAYLHDPRLMYVPATAQAAWMADVMRTRERASTPADIQVYRDFFRKGLDVTGAAHAAGVKIMAGTDSFDSFCFYGSALHDELGYLVEAGLTPLDALRAATLVPAEYAHREKDFGAIAPGRIADLVLLDANPLENIANVRAVRGVAFNGHFFDRAALDAILAEVKAAAAAAPK